MLVGFVANRNTTANGQQVPGAPPPLLSACSRARLSGCAVVASLMAGVPRPQPQASCNPSPVFERFLKAQGWPGTRTPVSAEGAACRAKLEAQIKQQQQEQQQERLQEARAGRIGSTMYDGWVFHPRMAASCHHCHSNERPPRGSRGLRGSRKSRGSGVWGTWTNDSFTAPITLCRECYHVLCAIATGCEE